MRIWFPFKRIGLLVVLIIISIVLLIFRSSKDFERESNFDKLSAQSSDSSKWKVLFDGTVVHSGNFSNDSFKKISFDIDSDICDNLSSDSLKVLILIESKSDNFERREAIRQTWALRQRQESLNFRVAFLLGITDSTSDEQNTMTQVMVTNLF